MSNFDSIDYRLEILEEIYKSQENKNRKAESFQQYEIYNDRLGPYVKGELVRQLSQKTADTMPITDSVNICRKIVKSEASIYKNPPKRTFSELSVDAEEAVRAIYDDGKFNVKFSKSNEFYKLQNQGLIQVIPKMGKLEMRVFLSHNYDVVPNDENPEMADAIIISSFDRSGQISSDGVNQKIADKDDSQKAKDKFTVWTEDRNFIMNGVGEITSDKSDVENHIGVLPFVDIFSDKEFEYFVRQGSTLANFTIAHNVDLSDLGQISRLQGYAQAYWKGEKMPEEIKVGPTHILHLTPNVNSQSDSDFGFANPSPNIEASIKVIVLKLANYLSSRGVDTNAIQTELNGAKTFSSGLERLLAMIERFEAARADFELYQDVEQKVYELVKKWVAYGSNSDLLDSKYHAAGIENSYLTVAYSKPESVQTDAEKIAYIQSRIDLGISDKVDALMMMDGIEEDDAIQQLMDMRDRAAIIAPKPAPMSLLPAPQLPILPAQQALPAPQPPQAMEGLNNGENSQPKTN